MLTKRVASENFEQLRFKLSYSTERTGAPRDMAEGYSDTGRAQWDVSQWDVSTRWRQNLYGKRSFSVTTPCASPTKGWGRVKRDIILGK